MQRQHLTARAADPLAVVSDLCGLHAQVLSSAQLTLWARMDNPPDVRFRTMFGPGNRLPLGPIATRYLTDCFPAKP